MHSLNSLIRDRSENNKNTNQKKKNNKLFWLCIKRIMKSTHSLDERTSRNGNTQHFLVSKERAPHTTVRKHTKHKIQIYNSLLYTLCAAHKRKCDWCECEHMRLYTWCCECVLCIRLNGPVVWVNGNVFVCMWEWVFGCVAAIRVFFFNGCVGVEWNSTLMQLVSSTYTTLDLMPRFVVFGCCCMSVLYIVSSLHSPARAFLTHATKVVEKADIIYYHIAIHAFIFLFGRSVVRLFVSHTYTLDWNCQQQQKCARLHVSLFYIHVLVWAYVYLWKRLNRPIFCIFSKTTVWWWWWWVDGSLAAMFCLFESLISMRVCSTLI